MQHNLLQEYDDRLGHCLLDPSASIRMSSDLGEEAFKTITSMAAAKRPQIWSLYKSFQAKGPNSAVLVVHYNLIKAVSVPAGSAAVNEDLRSNGASSVKRLLYRGIRTRSWMMRL
jgi:hypothetical protein